MTVYRQKHSQPLKWLVALIVFCIALGITFSDVHGSDGIDYGSGDDGKFEDTPTPVPEPTTLLLMAGGLGALRAVRRWKNRSK